jgi:predicted ATPase
MSQIRELNIKIKSKKIQKKDLTLFINNTEQTIESNSSLIFIEEYLKRIRVYSFLLGLYDSNTYSFTSTDLINENVEYPIIYRTINEMDDQGLFHFRIWDSEGVNSFKVINNTRFHNFILNELSVTLNQIMIEFESEEDLSPTRRSTPILKFYRKGYEPKNRTYPNIIFKKDNWNDFSYKTSFILSYHLSENNIVDLGLVKILKKDTLDTKIPNEFSNLSDAYCSLAPSEQYYVALFDLRKRHYEAILHSLNDIVYNVELFNEFKNVPGFNKSLLRGSEAEKTLKEARNYFNDNLEIGKNRFSFTYSTLLKGADEPHKISFDFSINEYKPFRIISLIGENGTGKTEILSRLAQSLSGEEKMGDFHPNRPPFSKILLISYSPFDDFKESNPDPSVSYSYFGLKNSKNIIDFEKARKDFSESLLYIKENNMVRSWKDTLSLIINESAVNKIHRRKNTTDHIISIDKLGLSSGQQILAFIFTNIIATIERESLILFDEPETFLHPNLVSKLMSALYKLLERSNSYAIVSTHSPIVLQEMPSNCVRVLHRLGNTPFTRSLGVESFGENLSAITKDVFGVVSTNVNFKKHIENMKMDLTYDEILDKFDNRLSFNAKMYIKSLFDDRS